MLTIVKDQSFAAMQAILATLKFGRAPAVKKDDEVDREAIKQIASLRDDAKKTNERSHGKMVSTDSRKFF